MKLRASQRAEGGWANVELPADPELLQRWLFNQDGKEAVVLDEETKRYYCGSMTLIDGYRGKGLEADSFYPLAKYLWESTGGKQ